MVRPENSCNSLSKAPPVRDVARMAWTDVAGNAINVVQVKTGARLTIPLHPNLAAALRAWPRKHVVILTTAFNKPFTYAGYGNMIADAIAAAALPDRCVLHGLRKAAARRLAEAGCTEKEIAAVTGHTTLKEVARYTRAADQKRLAAGAVAKLVEQKPHENSQPGFGRNACTKGRAIRYPSSRTNALSRVGRYSSDKKVVRTSPFISVDAQTFPT